MCALSYKKAVVTFIVILLLASCSPRIRTIQLKEVHTEWQDRVRIDSVYIRDSIRESERKTGDTVWRDREVWRWRERTVRDTIRFHKTDTIPLPVEVVREVPRPFFGEVRRTAVWLCLPLILGIIALTLWRRRK